MTDYQLRIGIADPRLLYRHPNRKSLYIVAYVDAGLVLGDRSSGCQELRRSYQSESEDTRDSRD